MKSKSQLSAELMAGNTSDWTREDVEVISDLAVAFTAKNLKRAQEAYEKA